MRKDSPYLSDTYPDHAVCAAGSDDTARDPHAAIDSFRANDAGRDLAARRIIIESGHSPVAPSCEQVDKCIGSIDVITTLTTQIREAKSLIESTFDTAIAELYTEKSHVDVAVAERLEVIDALRARFLELALLVRYNGELRAEYLEALSTTQTELNALLAAKAQLEADRKTVEATLMKTILEERKKMHEIYGNAPSHAVNSTDTPTDHSAPTPESTHTAYVPDAILEAIAPMPAIISTPPVDIQASIDAAKPTIDPEITELRGEVADLQRRATALTKKIIDSHESITNTSQSLDTIKAALADIEQHDQSRLTAYHVSLRDSFVALHKATADAITTFNIDQTVPLAEVAALPTSFDTATLKYPKCTPQFREKLSMTTARFISGEMAPEQILASASLSDEHVQICEQIISMSNMLRDVVHTSTTQLSEAYATHTLARTYDLQQQKLDYVVGLECRLGPDGLGGTIEQLKSLAVLADANDENIANINRTINSFLRQIDAYDDAFTCAKKDLDAATDNLAVAHLELEATTQHRADIEQAYVKTTHQTQEEIFQSAESAAQMCTDPEMRERAISDAFLYSEAIHGGTLSLSNGTERKQYEKDSDAIAQLKIDITTYTDAQHSALAAMRKAEEGSIEAKRQKDILEQEFTAARRAALTISQSLDQIDAAILAAHAELHDIVAKFDEQFPAPTIEIVEPPRILEDTTSQIDTPLTAPAEVPQVSLAELAARRQADAITPSSTSTRSILARFALNRRGNR